LKRIRDATWESIILFYLQPLALGLDEPGKEIEAPMAIVILGGLLTSTALNMIVVPSLFFKFAKNRRIEK